MERVYYYRLRDMEWDYSRSLTSCMVRNYPSRTFMDWETRTSAGIKARQESDQFWLKTECRSLIVELGSLFDGFRIN